MSAGTGERRGQIGRRRALFLGLTAAGTVNPMLGDIHRVAQRGPDLAWRIASCESVGGSQSELIQHHIAHEGATEMLAELGRHREGEFGMLHFASVPALKVSEPRLRASVRIDVDVCDEFIRQVIRSRRHDVVEVGHRLE